MPAILRCRAGAATLSPQRDWFVNVSLARRVLVARMLAGDDKQIDAAAGRCGQRGKQGGLSHNR